MSLTPFYLASADTIIRAVNASDVISTLVFTSTDPTYIANGGFGVVGGMVADASGNVYVADAENGGIFKVSPTLNVTLVPGTGALNAAWMTLDTAGNLYFSDGENSLIHAVNLQSTTQTLLNVVIAAGANAVVAGTGVLGYSGDGGQAVLAKIVGYGGVAVDPSGNLYFNDVDGSGGAGYRVRKVTPAGIISTACGTGVFGSTGDGGPATSARISDVAALACDAAGNFYIFDYNFSKVRAINTQATTQVLFNVSIAAGDIKTIAGTGTFGFSGDGGPALSAEIGSSNFLNLDSLGNLFFCDNGNFRVRMITPGGIISTVAGNGTSGNTGDGGAATSAEIGPNMESLAFASPVIPVVLSVSPASLTFYNLVWTPYLPAVGSGAPQFGSQGPLELAITAGGAWTATSESGMLLILPALGTGNSGVLVGINKNFNFPRSIYANRIKTGTYTDTILLTSGDTTVMVPVTFSVGYGDSIREVFFTPNLNPASIS